MYTLSIILIVCLTSTLAVEASFYTTILGTVAIIINGASLQNPTAKATPNTANDDVDNIPLCWVGNTTACFRKQRNPAYLQYFFSDYLNCKPPKNLNKTLNMKANDVFEQPKGMNTFRHFLGFRNPILCTMKINFKENEVTFGAFSLNLPTIAINDTQMYRVCRPYDFHLDVENDAVKDPMPILVGCICNGVHVNSNQVVESIYCCCVPRARDYTLRYMTNVLRVSQLKISS